MVEHRDTPWVWSDAETRSNHALKGASNDHCRLSIGPRDWYSGDRWPLAYSATGTPRVVPSRACEPWCTPFLERPPRWELHAPDAVLANAPNFGTQAQPREFVHGRKRRRPVMRTHVTPCSGVGEPTALPHSHSGPSSACVSAQVCRKEDPPARRARHGLPGQGATGVGITRDDCHANRVVTRDGSIAGHGADRPGAGGCTSRHATGAVPVSTRRRRRGRLSIGSAVDSIENDPGMRHLSQQAERVRGTGFGLTPRRDIRGSLVPWGG